MSERNEQETFAQYRFRVVREERLRKEAIAREAIESKRQRQARSEADRRRDRERRRQIAPALLDLVGITEEQLREAAKAKAEKAEEIENRKQSKVCICCGDDKDIRRGGHCQQCWNELTHGIIELPTISERQIESAKCRVVRKGSEMS
jgi:hypothetical protein